MKRVLVSFDEMGLVTLALATKWLTEVVLQQSSY
jgi:hypothetical protein